MPESREPAQGEAIAVVGMACKFPDADDPAALLDLALTGRRAFRRLPSQAPAAQAPAVPGRRVPAPRAALIENWHFDYRAFGLTDSAFRAGHPAQWLALETAARSLADAGFPAGEGLAADRAGVIIGATPESGGPGAIAARICGQFGLRGGGHAVDSAHSSSLLAVAAACAALTAGDLDVALAGGVDISPGPARNTRPAGAQSASRDGLLAGEEMRIYDASPTGFWPGEGCGILTLMRAADARAARLPVYAEIAGWGVASSGHPALGRPDPGSYLLALGRASQRAGIDPGDVQLIEGDGSGAALADHAELTALAQIREGAAADAVIGSIKASIGHARAAAGAAGLVKAILAVAGGIIPPTTGCEHPHPLLTGGQARLRIARAVEPWPEGPRIAAVSAMGPGGCDVHLILRRDTGRGSRRRAPLPVRQAAAAARARRLDGEPVHAVTRAAPHRARAFVLSAPDRRGLATQLIRIAELAPWLSDAELADLACQLGRAGDSAPVRAGLVAASQEQLARLAGTAAGMLPGLSGGRLATAPGIFAADGARGRVALLFPGEGAPAGGARGHVPPSIAGPAVLASSLAALSWLEGLGVRAGAAAGHGLGEITGLVWAGCLTPADASRLAAQRAAMLRTPGIQRTAMVHVAADLATAESFCAKNDLVIAAYNGPRCHVLAGPAAAVRDVVREAAERAIPACVLDVPGGLHTPAAADLAAPLSRMLAELRFSRPARRLISAVTGRVITPADDVPALLAAQLTSPVRFTVALGEAADGADLLVETGPGHGLSLLAAACCAVPAVSLGSGRGDDDAATRSAAALFAAGAVATLAPLHTAEQSRPIDIWRNRTFIAAAGQPPAATPARLAGSGLSGGGLHGGGREMIPPARDDGPAGIGPWVRCFTEELRPAPVDERVPVAGPWRIRVADRQPYGRMVGELFEDDPAAGCVLVIIGDPARPDACATLLSAAREAVRVGRLVVISPGAGLSGFCASLHAEHPSLGVTLIRTVPGGEGLRAARPFAVAEPGRFRDLVIDQAGSAMRPVMTAAEPSGVDTFPLGPADVVLLSGLHGGGALAYASALAGRGAALAVIGPPALDDDPVLTSAVETLRAGGTRVFRECTDLTDPVQVTAAVHRIEREVGPVTAVAHAASPAGLRPVSGLADADVRGYLAAELTALASVLGAITATRLRLLLTSGWTAGRYGIKGACALALADAAIAAQARRAGARRGCRVLHVQWPLWSPARESSQAGSGRPVHAGHAGPVPVPAASGLLLSMLATPGMPARVAVHGRLGAMAPDQEGMNQPGGAGPGSRFLEDVRVCYPGVEIVADARLTATADPYLADYQIDDLPFLPATMGLEAMAQAAAALAGRPLRQARDVSMDVPIVVPPGPDGPAARIRVCALRRRGVVETVIRSEVTGFAVNHMRAVFGDPPVVAGLEPDPAGHSATPGWAVDGTDLYGTVCYQSGRFRRVAFLTEVTSRTCRALVRGGDDQPWFAEAAGPAGSPLILGSPGLNDVTWHVLQACLPHRRVLPAGCEAATFHGEEVRGALKVRGQRRPGAAEVWDVTAMDATGRSIAAWTGLRLRSIGPLGISSAWHPALLAASLEGRAAEFGLDRSLRVTISSTHSGGGPDEPRAGHSGPQTGPAGTGWSATVPGLGPLTGLELHVSAGRPVNCHWEIIGPESPSPRNERMTRLRQLLGTRPGETPPVLDARLRAIEACLPAPATDSGAAGADPGAGDPGRPAGGALTLAVPSESGWTLVRAGDAAVACMVAEISGVPGQVAVAIMARRSGAEPGRPPEASGTGPARSPEPEAPETARAPDHDTAAPAAPHAPEGPDGVQAAGSPEGQQAPGGRPAPPAAEPPVNTLAPPAVGGAAGYPPRPNGISPGTAG